MSLKQADTLTLLNSLVVNNGGQWQFDFSGTITGERGRFKTVLDLLNAITVAARLDPGNLNSQVKGVIQSTGGPVRDLRSNGPLNGSLKIVPDGQVTEVWLKVSNVTGALQIQIENDSAKVGDIVYLFVEQAGASPLTPSFTDVDPNTVTNIAPTFGTQGSNGITQLTFLCKEAAANWILTSFAEIYWE